MLLDENLFEEVDLTTQQSEKAVDVEAKAGEVQNPVYADATRQMKKTAKVKKETIKVEKEEEHSEKTKNPKMTAGAKKMKLDEGLFEDVERKSQISYAHVNIVKRYIEQEGLNGAQTIDMLIDWADSVGELRMLGDVIQGLAERCEEFISEDLNESADNNVSVEVDFAIAVDDEEFDEVIKDICDEYHLTYEITQAEGPGGGWPVVKFTGSKANVIEYLKFYEDDDSADAEELLSRYSITNEGLYQAQEVFTDEENKTFAKSELGMIDKDKLSDEDRRMIARRKLGLDKKKVYIDPKDSWTPEERREYARQELGLKKKEESLEEALNEYSKLNWRGVEGVKLIDHGAYSDPELFYKDEDGTKYYANYWDVEDSMWEYFLEETGHKDAESGKPEVEAAFDKFCQEHRSSVISDIMDMAKPDEDFENED